MAAKGNRRAPRKPNGAGGARSGNRKSKSVSFLDVFNDNFQVQENESRDAEVFNNGEIKIEAPTGKIISLMVKGSDTIGSIKLKIQTAEGIPFDQQELIFNGLVLEDIKILADLPINDSVLKLVCKSSTLKNGKINIVETATGNIIPLKFKRSDTIGSIKLNIQKKEGETWVLGRSGGFLMRFLPGVVLRSQRRLCAGINAKPSFSFFCSLSSLLYISTLQSCKSSLLVRASPCDREVMGSSPARGNLKDIQVRERILSLISGSGPMGGEGLPIPRGSRASGVAASYLCPVGPVKTTYVVCRIVAVQKKKEIIEKTRRKRNGCVEEAKRQRR
ncbi:hypothetical protein R6Q59_024516 [Mikania micrantha]